MHAIGIIPARYQSTRFPGKPLALIHGKSLIQRTYESARACPQLAQLVVATDDQRIYDHVVAFGGTACMTCPSCPNGTARLADALKRYPELAQADIVVNIQGDEPCLPPDAVSACIQALIDNPTAMVATPVTPLEPDERQSCHIVKCVTDLQGKALYFSRAPLPTEWRHVGLYAYRRDFLQQYASLPTTPYQLAEDLEQLKILEHGYSIQTVRVAHAAIGVDIPDDISTIEAILCKQSASS